MNIAARSSINPARPGLMAAAFFTLCLLFLAADSAHAETLAAKLTYKEGAVLVSRNGAPFAAVKTGQRLIEGDMIKTGKDAKAILTLNENSTINMGPESRLEIKQYLFNYDTEKRNVVIKGYSGKLRFVVSKILKASATGQGMAWNDSNFIVQTPTATAGIKGTTFAAVISSNHTFFGVSEGAIVARNISSNVQGKGEADVGTGAFGYVRSPTRAPADVPPQQVSPLMGSITGLPPARTSTLLGRPLPDVGNEVIIGANQSSVVRRDAGPTAVKIWTKSQQQNFLRDTTPAVTAKNDAGSQGIDPTKQTDDRLIKPVDKSPADSKSKENESKEQSDKQAVASIIKDAAEGKKTGDIIDGLIASGNNVNEAVTLVIAAKVADPALVINTTITNGYGSADVLKGAFDAGVKTDVAAKAALNAGAEKKEIMQAAKDAGLSKKDMAKLVDNVAKTDTTSGNTSGDTVFGFTDPEAPVKNDVVFVSSGSNTVGGGGGAAASTATASGVTP